MTNSNSWWQSFWVGRLSRPFLWWFISCLTTLFFWYINCQFFVLILTHVIMKFDLCIFLVMGGLIFFRSSCSLFYESGASFYHLNYSRIQMWYNVLYYLYALIIYNTYYSYLNSPHLLVNYARNSPKISLFLNLLSHLQIV